MSSRRIGQGKAAPVPIPAHGPGVPITPTPGAAQLISTPAQSQASQANTDTNALLSELDKKIDVSLHGLSVWSWIGGYILKLCILSVAMKHVYSVS